MPFGVGLWAFWQVLVGIAKSATPRVFGREQNGGPGTAVRTVQVDIQFVRGRPHWLVGILNDRCLRDVQDAGPASWTWGLPNLGPAPTAH
jgi:hypothetical protein